MGTEWDNVGGAGTEREEFVVDALGTIRRKSSPLATGFTHPHDWHYAYSLHPGTGRVTQMVHTDTIQPILEPFAGDLTQYTFDSSGNLTKSAQSREGAEYLRQIVTRNWYSADERLMATQVTDEEGAARNGSWEEYRYDPLGRRILVRAVREDMCGAQSYGSGQTLCQSTLTRYVWSGDQILWEMRVPGQDGADLERTSWSGTNSIRFGRVSYLHAGGIDRPLAIKKDGLETVVPHQNWRGMFAWGSWGSGTNKGLLSDCTPSNLSTCVNLAWPGYQTSAYHADGNPGETEYWMGSLVDGMRDASGQIYMRNRYYDPATGQFTQTDPIGLAGGLNVYGFANGDPVSYSDPYGLCPRTAALLPAIAADGPAPVVDAGLALSCIVELGVIGFRLVRTARLVSEVGDAALADGAVATKSHRTAQERINRRYGEVMVHWEESTAGGDPGNVHVQNKNGTTDIGKIYIQSADDLRKLPDAIRNNERIQRGIRRALEQLEKFRESQAPTTGNR